MVQLKRQGGPVADLLALDLTHAQVRYAGAWRDELAPGDRWLDLGCGHQVVPPWAVPPVEQGAVAARAALAVGVDMDPSIHHHEVLRLRAMASGYALPFRGSAFDLVTANMVLEHVDDPVALLREVHRVLAPGGRFVFHTPNRRNPAVRIAAFVPSSIKRGLVWWLENRREEDVFPTHYRINSARDIRAAAEAAGFRIDRLQSWSSVGVLSAVPVLRTLELPVLWLLEQDWTGDRRSNYFVRLVRV